MKKIIILISVHLIFNSKNVNCQNNEFSPLNPAIDEMLINGTGTRSLVVFKDGRQNQDISSIGGVAGKIFEMEFDTFGNKIYHVFPNEYHPLPSLYMYQESALQSFEYSLKNKLKSYHYEMSGYQFNNLYLYGDNDRLIKIATRTGEDDGPYQSHLYKNEKLIRVEVRNCDSCELIGYTDFDHLERPLKVQFNTFTAQYSYTEDKNTTITKVTNQLGKKTTSVQIFQYEKGGKKLIHYSEKNSDSNESIEMEAKYDEFGNAIYYKLSSNNKERSNEDIDFEYQIENAYSDNGLLRKRTFFTLKDEKRLIEVHYYFFDSVPLLFKIKNGQLSNWELEFREDNELYNEIGE